MFTAFSLYNSPETGFVSNNRRIDRQIIVCSYKEILFGNKRKEAYL